MNGMSEPTVASRSGSSELYDGGTVPQAGGLIYKNHLAMIGLMDVPSRPGVGGQFFTAVAQAGIRVELIVNVSNRAPSEWRAPLEDRQLRDHIVLCVDRRQLDQVLEIARKVQEQVGGEALVHDPDVALVSIFSTDPDEIPAIAAHMFRALGDRGINIHGISTSVSTITCLLEGRDLEAAVATLRKAFILP